MMSDPSNAVVSAGAPGRVALVGEYLDAIFANRAITCGLQELQYEIRVSAGSQGHPPVDDGINNLRLVPEVLNIFREQGITIPNLHVEIRAHLPAGSGLGSSAAFAVAVSAAANLIGESGFSPATLAECAVRAEAAMGITGGKMDQYSAAFGGLNSFRFSASGAVEATPLHFPADATIVIIDSGVRRRSGDVIDEVLRRGYANEIDVADFVQAGVRVADAMDALMTRPEYALQDLGDLVNEAHRGLRDYLEVSSPDLERLIDLSLESGALGAKIIGAGKGGCIFALCASQRSDEIVAAVRHHGTLALVCTPSVNGAWAEVTSGSAT